MNNVTQSVPIKETKSDKFIPPKQHLGASQFAAALGLNQFLKPNDLKMHLEKGYIWEDNPKLTFGHKKEKLAKYFYQKISGNKIRRAYFVKDLYCPRLVGICDGLVGDDGGVEIKCHYEKEHPLKTIPIYYLVQIAGYLHLYNKSWWDFMSCVFNDKDEICRCRIIRINREDIQDAWDNEWYPGLIEYIDSIAWMVVKPKQTVSVPPKQTVKKTAILKSVV